MVVAVIAILIGILIPVVGKIRKSSQEATTRALLTQIDAACQAYFSDFSAYPGPLSANFMVSAQKDSNSDTALYFFNGSTDTQPLTDGDVASGPTDLNADVKRLTGTENLVLGLLGGLQVHSSGSAEWKTFKKDDVGLGAVRFNPKRPGRANAYIQPTNLSAGKFTEDAMLNPPKDTEVPEFVDSFSNPMPVLYMRARKGGAAADSANIDEEDNNVVTDNVLGTGAIAGQYNLLEIAAYTQSSIGIGKTLKESDYKNHPATGAQRIQYPHGLISVDTDSTLGSKASASQYPYNAYAYLMEPSSNDVNITNANDRLKKHQARKKDQFILISAGVDRIYGTEDDITNFGDVLP